MAFDPSTAKPAGFDPATAAVVDPKARTLTEKVKDTGLGILGGIASMGAGVADMADRTSGNQFNLGQQRDALNRTADAINAQKSDALKLQNQEVAQAKGVTGTLGALWDNPGAAVDQLAGSVAYIPAIAAAARGAPAGMATTNVAVAGGLLEGADAGNSAHMEVMRAPEEQLLASPKYQSLLASGMQPQEARAKLANDASAYAAGITAPVAAIAGKVTGAAGLESALFRRNAVGSVTGTLAKEGAEEVIQEGVNQFGQNVGLQQTVNPNQDLMAGVPEASTMGAVLGVAQGGGVKLTETALDMASPKEAPVTKVKAQDPVTGDVAIETPQGQSTVIRPADGPLSKAAATAVTTGATQEQEVMAAAKAAAEQDGKKPGSQFKNQEQPVNAPVNAAEVAPVVNQQAPEVTGQGPEVTGQAPVVTGQAPANVDPLTGEVMDAPIIQPAQEAAPVAPVDAVRAQFAAGNRMNSTKIASALDIPLAEAQAIRAQVMAELDPVQQELGITENAGLVDETPNLQEKSVDETANLQEQAVPEPLQAAFPSVMAANKAKREAGLPADIKPTKAEDGYRFDPEQIRAALTTLNQRQQQDAKLLAPLAKTGATNEQAAPSVTGDQSQPSAMEAAGEPQAQAADIQPLPQPAIAAEAAPGNPDNVPVSAPAADSVPVPAEGSSEPLQNAPVAQPAGGATVPTIEPLTEKSVLVKVPKGTDIGKLIGNDKIQPIWNEKKQGYTVSKKHEAKVRAALEKQPVSNAEQLPQQPAPKQEAKPAADDLPKKKGMRSDHSAFVAKLTELGYTRKDKTTFTKEVNGKTREAKLGWTAEGFDGSVDPQVAIDGNSFATRPEQLEDRPSQKEQKTTTQVRPDNNAPAESAPKTLADSSKSNALDKLRDEGFLDEAGEVIAQPDWQNHLIRARQYASNLVKAGNVPSEEVRNQLTAAWNKLDELVPLIEGITAKEAAKEVEASASAKVASWVVERLKAGEKISAPALFQQSNEAFGGTQGQGKYTPKDAYDALELGINQFLKQSPAFAPNGTAKQAAETVAALQSKILDLIPTQTKRTQEQDEFQQFSTPPTYAFLSNWAANIKAGETMVEPSAGIGGLAVFADLAGADVVVNEFSPRRAEVLREMGFDRVLVENAEQLNNVLPADIKPTVIVMNPPFSSTAGRIQGQRSTSNGAKHIEQALKRLEEGGRLVAIVGEGMADNRPAFSSWWKKIKAEYNVRANIGIDGKGYAKYGTTFDNQILVIDKNGPTTGTVVTDKVDSVQAAIPLLEPIRNVRPEASQPTQPAAGKSGSTESAAKSESASTAGQPAPAEPVSVGARAGRDRLGAAGKPGSDSGSSRVDDSGRKGGQRNDSADSDSGRGTGADAGRPAGNADRSGRESDLSNGQPDTELTVEGKQDDAQSDISDSVFEQYQPQRVRIPGAKAHPGPLVQSAAMASVPPPAPTYTPNLPKEVIEKGLLSSAQLETVVYAGQSHSQLNADGTRRGYFIGDGTGVGKGREISGILLDNMRHGRKKAVWISEKQGLFEDAKRDFAGVGGDPKLITAHKKIKATDSIPDGDGILFSTYSTLRSGQKKQKVGEKTKTRLDQMVEWLGPDFDGVIAFDEAHNMGNAIAMKGKRGVKKASEQALAGVELQKKLPKARVVYVSATGATEVSNLSYATRLGLWGQGTPFANVEEFINQISSGGLAAMELVARDMKQMGLYIARSLSYDGVTYSRLEHPLTPLQRDIYNEMAKAWQVVLKNINEALKITGVTSENGKTLDANAKSAALSAFWSGQQRFFNQILTSMQMPTVVEQVKRDIAEGKAPVLQLVNTNEAVQNRQIATMDEDESLEDLDLTPRENLIQMVRTSFPVMQFEEYQDENGNVRSRPVQDSKGNPVINKEAEQKRDELIKNLEQIRVPDGPLEILLKEFGPERVAEVTGRTQRVVVVRNDKGKMETKVERRGSTAAAADAEAFMAGNKDMLVFSDAGGTGFSFHADKTKKNQKKRTHYLVQPGWRADKAVQGFGRTHRTNQDSTPHYYLPTTDLPAQARFISSIARRLNQLGALTKGQRDTANQGLFSEKDNLESQYASDAITQLFTDLYRNKVVGMNFDEMASLLGFDALRDKDGGLNESKIPAVPQFLNRLLSLTDVQQRVVFDAFISRMEAKIEAAIAAGTLDVGMETLQALETEVKGDQVVHTDEKTGSETRYVELELTQPYKFNDWKQVSKAPRFVQGKRGKVYAVFPNGTETKSSGAVVDRVKLVSITGATNYEADQITPDRYDELTRQGAELLWNEQIKEHPKTYKEPAHIITGALLPIWDRMPQNNVRVVRVQSKDGKRYLGRFINRRDLAETLKKLGANSAASQLPPAKVFEKAKQGQTVELVNNWKIEQKTVSGEKRLEVTTRGYMQPAVAAELRSYGAFIERIQWQERAFIPTSAEGEQVVAKLIKAHPVSDISGEEESEPKYSLADDFGLEELDFTEAAGLFGEDLSDPTAQAFAKSMWQSMGFESPFFKRWFGDSKIKTSDGKPIPVYHATDATFTAFDKSRAGSATTYAASGLGIFTTPSRETASKYGQHVMKMYARIERPYMMSLEEFSSFEELGQAKKRSAELQKAGYDGIVVKANGTVIAFDSSQLKGVSNVGTFNKANADIRYKTAGKGNMTAADVQRIADDIKGSWTNGPKVAVVQSVKDLPFKADSRAAGAYHDGKVYLVADNLKGSKHAEFVLLHETAGHYGLAGIFGKQLDPAMLNIYRQNSRVRAAADEWMKRHNSKNTALAVEEVLSDMAGEGIRPSGLDRIITAIRNALRRLGFVSQFSDAEIRMLLGAARSFVEAGTHQNTLPTDAKYSIDTGAVRDRLTDLLSTSKTFNLWNKSVGTQFHKAWKDEDFKRVFDISQEFLNDTSQSAIDAANLAPDILPKLESVWTAAKQFVKSAPTAANLLPGVNYKTADQKDIDAAAQSIFGGTLIDERVYSDSELRRKGLTDKQIELYKQARTAIDKSLTDLAASDMGRLAKNEDIDSVVAAAKANPEMAAQLIDDALQAQIDDMKDRAEAAKKAGQDERAKELESAAGRKENLRKQIRAVDERITELKEKGYAPLMRFGQYTVTVKNDQGETEFFGMFDTEREANAMRRQMEKQYEEDIKGGAITVSQGVMSQEGFKLFQGMSPDTMELFAHAIGADQTEVFQEYIKLAIANRSALKRLIQRQGIAGFNPDLSRVLSSFITSNARAGAKNWHYGDMLEAAQLIPNRKGDVKDEAIKLLDYLQNPQEEAAGLRGLLFVHFLGGSVASAAVNMTQPFMMTFPYLARFGARKAAAVLAKYTPQAWSKHANDPELEKALQRAEAEGIVAPHELHQLYAESIRGLGSNLAIRSGLRVWGSLFSLAEAFNRRLTFMAAYDIARQMKPAELRATGYKSAFDFAVNAISETQGLYNRGNRPNWARGALGATVFTFKQYSVAYLEFLKRLPKRERAIAIALLVLAAGLQGLPGADDIEDLADTLGQMAGYNVNTKEALRQAAIDTLGETLGGMLTGGFSQLPGFPLDVQARMGLGNLIPGTGMFKKSNSDPTREITETIGPVGGLVRQGKDAFANFAAGDIGGGFAAMAPVALQNAIKGADMWSSGMYKDQQGRKVTDVDQYDAAIKAIGFQPARVAADSRKLFAVKQRIDLARNVEGEIAEQWARGLASRDPAEIRKAKEKLAEWNQKNPDTPIAISARQILQRVKAMKMSRDERFIRTAPKELRGLAASAVE